MSQSTDSPKTEDLKYPETVTINGISYVLKETPELMNLVSLASKVEKNKLYTKFDQLKNELNGLKAVEVIPQPGFDAENFRKEMLGEMKEMLAPVLHKAETVHQETIEDYRNRLIQENATRCFPEIVKGNTREELDASLQESIAMRAKYSPGAMAPAQGLPVVDPLIAQQMNQVNQEAASQNVKEEVAPQVVAPTPAPPPIPRVEAAPPVSTNVGKLSQKEFENRRESLESELKSLFPMQ